MSPEKVVQNPFYWIILGHAHGTCSAYFFTEHCRVRDYAKPFNIHQFTLSSQRRIIPHVIAEEIKLGETE